MDNRNQRLLNRVLKIIAGSYVIVFIPLILAYFSLRYFTVFTERMLVYALIPLAVVLLILFIVYLIRVARTGHFWNGAYNHKGS